MSRFLCILISALTLVQGSPQTQHQRSIHHHGNPGHISNHTHTQLTLQTQHNMPVVELNPGHYPANRAAVVAQHHLNTQHGSPYRWLGKGRVLSATMEEVAEGRKYNVTFMVKDAVTEQAAGQCSAEVLFPANQSPPQVHCSCDDLLKNNTTEQEEALYQHLKSSASLVSSQHLPDSFGFIAPEMKPFWHLGGVAASFVMLKESNESTLYNMAQVANVTQQETQNNTLMFQYHILLHEMVSQEIIRWKLQVSWCPAEGVRVLSAEWQPKCQHCVVPLTNTTNQTPASPEQDPNTANLTLSPQHHKPNTTLTQTLPQHHKPNTTLTETRPQHPHPNTTSQPPPSPQT